MLAGAFFVLLPPVMQYKAKRTEKILVAVRHFADPYFEKTLVWVTGNSLTGWRGVILNRPLTAAQHSQLPAFIRDQGIRVDYGGPIDFPGAIMVLEARDSAMHHGRRVFLLRSWEQAVADTPGLLDKIRQGQHERPPRMRVFAGFAGWMGLQLEHEILFRFYWRNIPARPDIVWQSGGQPGWETIENGEAAKEKMQRARRT